jgi:hypothetical protein
MTEGKRENIPFATGSLGNGSTAPSLPGYLTRIYGAFVSAAPFGTVSGPASFSLEGQANVVAGSGMVFNFMPSTTDVANVPIDFGPLGIEAAGPGPTSPITFTISASGSDSLSTVTLNIWGVLEPVD